MTSITIELDGLERVRAALQQLQEAGSDLSPAFSEIGDRLIALVKDGFETGTDPAGRRWAPLKRRKGKPLLDTGTLMRSFIRSASEAGVTVGTATVSAALHQFGGKAGRNRATTVPARPMLPADALPADWEAEIMLGITRFLSQTIKELS